MYVNILKYSFPTVVLVSLNDRPKGVDSMMIITTVSTKPKSIAVAQTTLFVLGCLCLAVMGTMVLIVVDPISTGVPAPPMNIVDSIMWVSSTTLLVFSFVLYVLYRKYGW